MTELEATNEVERLPQAKPKRKKSVLRRAGKVLMVLGVVMLLLLVALFSTGVWLVRRAWPQVSGTISAHALQSAVEVRRDKWGVAHIYAQNSHDLFFSQGYVQAQDRMWQLEFNRRLGSGRLCEFLGPDAMALDRFTRVVGLRRAAQRDWEKMQSEDRAALSAYAEGINAYLKDNRGKLSVEFRIFGIDPEPWEPVDSLVVIKLMSWVLSENATIQLSRARIIAKSGEPVAKQILPAYADDAPVIVPKDVAGYSWLGPKLIDELKAVAKTLGTEGQTKGSNSWVVAGNRTATGRPIVGNDTHLDLFMPSVWYANGLHGGGYDVVGYSLAGTPGISIGHNQRIAWGITDLVADVQDFYVEKLDNEADPQRYEFRGEWLPLKFENEEIKVKGEKPVHLRVALTHHGPLVNNWITRFNDSRPLSLAWAAGDSDTLIQSLLLLNRANNWDEFNRALSFWNGPNINFVYGDVDGHIGYHAAGRIPVRTAVDYGIIPVPGWTGEYDWQGFVPHEGLPYMLNPPNGLVITANQKPVPNDYPYRMGYEWADPFRAMRLNQLLSVNQRFSMEDAERIMGDVYHLPAESLRPFLLTVKPSNELETRAVNELRAWNLNCDAEQVGAAVYQVWYRFLVEETLRDELGSELTAEYIEYYWIHGPMMVRLIKDGSNQLFDDASTQQAETRDDILRRSLAAAVDWLSKHHGSDPAGWKWGRLHTVNLRHRPFGMVQVPVVSGLFSYGPISAPGCDRFTVNATWFTWDDPEHPFGANAGTSQRIIMDVGDWDRSVGVNSTGQSELLFHRHRGDLIPMWQDLKYHPLLFSRKAVEAGTESLLNLVPSTASGS